MNKEILTSFHTSVELNTVDISSVKGCVVAVGVFDGVHLGHRALISALVAEGRRLGLPAVVFTFDFDDNPKVKGKMLFQKGALCGALADLGVDILLSAPFSSVKGVSACDFVNEFLYNGIGAKCVVCGYDFRFGRDRAGDAALIKSLLGDKGVSVITPDAILSEGEPVSSTRIRDLITKGEIKKANSLMCREFSFAAPVCHGAKLGRGLGFPTINQSFPAEMVTPPYGVYAVKVRLGDKIYGGVSNFGVKPTVASDCAPTCETYIFDYNEDCYGKVARIFFLDFIRPEQRFASLSELKAQVERDKTSAMELLLKGELI